MHLEEHNLRKSIINNSVSILVSNWMHLEDTFHCITPKLREVSILVSNWMHLEVDNLQMFTVYNA